MEYEGDDVEEAFGLTFQVTYSDVFGDLQVCNLKKDGESIPVTKDNKQVRTEGGLGSSSSIRYN